MKKSLLTVALLAMTAVASFAQGTIHPLNGSLTRVRIDDGDGVYSTTLDRQAATADGIKVGIFWGAAGGAAETLAGTMTIGATAGVMVGQPAIFALQGAGDVGAIISLQMRVVDSGNFRGQTDVKQVKLGSPSGPGTVVWSTTGADVNGSGTFRPLLVSVVPEPSTIALGVLGLGSLLLFRRRK